MFDVKNKYVKLIFAQGMSAEGFVFYQDKEQLALKTENTEDVLVVNKYLDTVLVIKILQDHSLIRQQQIAQKQGNQQNNFAQKNQEFQNKTFKPRRTNFDNNPHPYASKGPLTSRAIEAAKIHQQQVVQERKEIQEYLTNHPDLQDKDLTQNYEYPDLTKLKPLHHSAKKNR